MGCGWSYPLGLLWINHALFFKKLVFHCHTRHASKSSMEKHSSIILETRRFIVFGKPISHVSIYMGGGKMVQAPRPGKRVEVVKFVKMFGKKPFVGARRL